MIQNKCYICHNGCSGLQGIYNHISFYHDFHKKKKKNRTLTPNASPAMTLTSIPSLDETGMFSATISWIDGSCIFSFLARLIHSCRPWAFSSPCDHSQCMMPRPAVNH